MRAALFLTDTPDGLETKLVWQVNGHLDHLHDSIGMHLMAQFTEMIRQQEKLGALRLVKEEKPGDPPSARPKTTV